MAKQFSFFFIFLILLIPRAGYIANAQDGQDTEMLSDLDIPLMEGFKENDDARVVFDSPSGSIITAEAKGNKAAQEVYEYYKVVLPSLSWSVTNNKENNMICEENADFCIEAIREQEVLILQIKFENNLSIVNYALSPK